LEIFLDIVAQSFKRRNVEDFRAIRKIARQGFANQPVDAGKECGQRFSRAGRRRNEGRAPSQNMRPALLLRLGGRAELLNKPLRDKRMGPRKGSGKGLHWNIVAGESAFANCSLY
jgi:hypothetical protein